MNKLRKSLLFSFLLTCALAFTDAAVQAQTSFITYQGRLTDGAMAANGTYEMLFTLFDAASGGTQIGAPHARTVVATNGIFTVNNLTLGPDSLAFPGATRYLEIAVRPSGSPNPFTVLSPRQLVTSAPYAIRSLNAGAADSATNSNNLGGVAANQFVQTNDTRLTDSRDPNSGSGNYIQNQNAAPQTASNFNISGTGSAAVINSATQYNLGGSRLLSVSNGGTNFFAGINVGTSSTTGTFNSFFGTNAGQANTTASNNSFFGFEAGTANTTGTFNSFFGSIAGRANTTGSENAFFGNDAGDSNTTGDSNSFFGANAGDANTTGSVNAFFGRRAGLVNTTGFDNAFFGANVGDSNTTGIKNSFFGSSAGSNTTTANNNSFFGFHAGQVNTNGGFNTIVGSVAGLTNTIGSRNTIIGAEADVASSNLTFATALGAGAVVSTSNTVVLGRSFDDVRVPGNLVVVTLGAAGSTSLCRNASNQISTCTAGNLAERNKGDNATLDALREQHAQMQIQIKQQQILIDGLRKLVCQNNPPAEVCREEK